MRINVTEDRCEIRGSRATPWLMILSVLQLARLALEVTDPDESVLMLALRVLLALWSVLLTVHAVSHCLIMDEHGIHRSSLLSRRRDTPWQHVTRISRSVVRSGAELVLHLKKGSPIKLDDDEDYLRLIRRYTDLTATEE